MHFEIFFDTAANATAHANGIHPERDSIEVKSLDGTGSSSSCLGTPIIAGSSHGRRWTWSASLTLTVATFGIDRFFLFFIKFPLDICRYVYYT